MTYYYYEPATATYQEYTATPAVWTSYYHEPSTQLYYYEPSTDKYVEEYEPSPYTVYYGYSESTQTYVPYEPTPVAWTDFYEVPSVTLYT
jgi:hypothetical protein